MGEITGAPTILLKLSEPTAPVFISDDKGNIVDFQTVPPNTVPAVVQGGITGFARVFDASALTAAEATASLLKFTRSVTIQFLLDFGFPGQIVEGTPGTIISSGSRDSSAEDLQFLVELLDSGTANVAILRMRWENTSGVLETNNLGAQFFVPSTGGTMLFTVVREWRSETEVIVRYYANDRFLGKDVSSDGIIGGVAGAQLILGARGDGAAGYENYLEGTLGALSLFEFPMTAEEIRQVFRRIVIHREQQYEALKSLLPQDVYSLDPSSIFQRELFADAQMFALLTSKIAEISEDFLPDRAWSFLEPWETVLDIPPLPNDTLAQRRNRLLSFLRTIQGFSVPKVQLALEPTMALDADDIQILENTNEILDTFDTATSNYFQEIPFGGTVAVVSAELVITAASGVEHEWISNGAGAGTKGAPHVKGSIDGDVEFDADPSILASVNLEISAVSFSATLESAGGIALINQLTNEIIVFAVADLGAGNRIVSFTFLAGVQSVTTDHAAAPATPFFLDVQFLGGSSYKVATALTADRNALTTVVTGVTGPTLPSMIALGMFGLASGGPTGADSVTFDDFRIFAPNGLRVFNWVAFRPPALAGTHDIAGADRVVQRLNPAHYEACATLSDEFLTDDPLSLTDCSPIG